MLVSKNGYNCRIIVKQYSMENTIRISNRIREKENEKLNNIIRILNDKINLMTQADNINNAIYLLLEIYSLFVKHYDTIDRYDLIITLNKSTLIDVGRLYIGYINDQNVIVDPYIMNKLNTVYIHFLHRIYNSKRGVRNIAYNEKNCPICFEEFTNKNVFIPGCFHSLCNTCVVNCSNCPICRKSYISI